MKLLVVYFHFLALVHAGWGKWGSGDCCQCPVERVRRNCGCDNAHGSSLTTPMHSGKCVDQPAPSCLMSKHGWEGYTCDYAKAWCNDPYWGAAARDCCPATCGVCPAAGMNSIVDNAIATPELSTLVAVLTDSRYADILGVLQGSGPMTVFAPNNAAFAAAGVDINNIAAVKQVLKYHVILGSAAYSKDLEAYQTVATAEGSEVLIIKTNAGVFVDDAKVVIADVASSNGVVHIINRVLLPPLEM